MSSTVTTEALDEAIRQHAKTSAENAGHQPPIVIAWAVVIEVIDSELDKEGAVATSTIVRDGQSAIHTLGLLVDATDGYRNIRTRNDVDEEGDA